MLATKIESFSLATDAANSWTALHNQPLNNYQWNIVDDVEESIETIVERLCSAAEVEHLHEIEEQEDE